MVKKLLLLFLISSVFYRNVEAQQPTQYTMYMLNPLQYNPAIAGKDDAVNIQGSRQQWVGFRKVIQLAKTYRLIYPLILLMVE